MAKNRKERIAARKAAQRRRWLASALIVGVFGVAIAFLTIRNRNPVAPLTEDELASLEVAPKTGALAPDFTLTDPGGAMVSLSDFRGKQVALNFMHTW